jgi:hypothetical protein
MKTLRLFGVAIVVSSTFARGQDDPHRAAPRAVEEFPHKIIASLREMGPLNPFSHGPRVLVYADRKIIYAKKTKSDAIVEYFAGTLTEEQFASLCESIRPSKDFLKLNTHLDLFPKDPLSPTTTLMVGIDGMCKVVCVTGYKPGMPGPFRSSPGARSAPNHGLHEFDRVATALVAVDPPDANRWQPELVTLLGVEVKGKGAIIQDWPLTWNNLRSPTTMHLDIGNGTINYYVFLPSEKLPEYTRLIEAGELFRINGKVCAFGTCEPVFPGSHRWNHYFRNVRRETESDE